MISIIVPTYNRADTLMRTVESVFRQTYPDWELIIVDDGSTDSSQAVYDSITDSRVRVIRHPVNKGVCGAKNTGLDNIRGDWFTILDSDDEIVPEALATMMECAERTGATAISCNCLDTVTGEFSGTSSLTQDGWMSAAEASTSRGEFWGITRTELLGDLRFDERVSGFLKVVWVKINRNAKRYYLHRGLRLYHTEGVDRVTVRARRRSLADSFRTFWALGTDAEYLRALKELDPQEYRREMLRIWPSRVVHPFLPAKKVRR